MRWLVSAPNEATMPGPYIPTYGNPASASDIYRVVELIESGHQGWNSAYIDVASCMALARLIKGPVRTWSDLEGAEVALQALFWHDRLDVLVPAFKVAHGTSPKRFFGYQRCDEKRTDLAFKLFKPCVPYDTMFVTELATIADGRVVDSTLHDSGILGCSLNEAAEQYLERCPVHAAVLATIPQRMRVAAYLSDRRLEPDTRRRGYFGKFYEIVRADWDAAAAVVPDVDYSISLPPLLSIVLDKASSRDAIPDAINDIRSELTDVRNELWRFTEKSRSSIGQAELEAHARFIQASFQSTFPASRQRKTRLRSLLKVYRTLKSPLDYVIKILNPEYRSEDDMRVASRTLTGRQFSELLRTETMHSLLSGFFTEGEIHSVEDSLSTR